MTKTQKKLVYSCGALVEAMIRERPEGCNSLDGPRASGVGQRESDGLTGSQRTCNLIGVIKCR